MTSRPATCLRARSILEAAQTMSVQVESSRCSLDLGIFITCHQHNPLSPAVFLTPSTSTGLAFFQNGTRQLVITAVLERPFRPGLHVKVAAHRAVIARMRKCSDNYPLRRLLQGATGFPLLRGRVCTTQRKVRHNIPYCAPRNSQDSGGSDRQAGVRHISHM